jgi:pSer/pThr/pTyr-binding forkhead associated (FHA) protein
VSEVHLKVFREGDGFLAFDVSTRGFVANGSRTQRALLAPGDTLQLGSHVLRVLSDAPDAVPSREGTPPPVPPGQALLVARKGNDAGKTFPLGVKPAMILGRGVATDVTIWDIRASRAHCRIDCAQGKYSITDLASSNGTYVNDEKITTHHLVRGDLVRIGSTVLEFQPG